MPADPLRPPYAASGALPAVLPSTIAALGWGGMFPVAAIAVERVDPFHLTAIRYLLAVAGFVVLLVATEGRAALRFEGRGLELWLLGSLGFAGFNLLTFLALEHTAPQHAALIVATSPLLTLLANAALSRTRPRPLTGAFVVLALAGVLLVIGHGDPASILHGGVRSGDGLVLLGVAGWIAYTLATRRHADLSPLRYTTLTALGGTATILAITETATLAGWLHAPSAADLGAVWWEIAYVVAIGALVAVLAWNEGVRRLGAPNAALFMNLVPVTTFAVAIAVQGYRPSAGELIGAAVTVAALVGANVSGRPSAQARGRRPVAASAVPSLAEDG